ncbi:hypothetical protein K9M79_07610 [Candidatus Woesearchaeota archaeon]|nr:hypothetical protein [Candidatus Woesearchaeota archaeon]
MVIKPGNILFAFIIIFNLTIFGCTSYCDPQKINQLIENKNHCEKDSDCTLLSEFIVLGCPFGCYNLVNKNEDFSEIMKLAQSYNENCDVCMYDCIQGPKQNEIECINNKCVANSPIS